MVKHSPANQQLLKGSPRPLVREKFVLIQLEQTSLFGKKNSQKEWTDFSREVSHDILMKRSN